MQLNTFLNFLRKVEPDVIWLRAKGLCLSAPQKKMNRVQPTENQMSMAIFLITDGLMFIIFFNRENFEQAALNIQI